MEFGYVVLTDEQKLVSRLPPGVIVNPKLCEESLMNDSEQSLAKIRWHKHEELEYNKTRLYKNYPKYSSLSEDERMKMEMKSAYLRQTFNPRIKSLDLAKKSVNVSKINAHIALPKELNPMENLSLNIRRDEMAKEI